MRHVIAAGLALIVVCFGSPAVGQSQSQRGRLLVTVADTTGAVIPNAKVSVVGLEDATRAQTVPPVQTSPEGVATLTGLPQGRYTILAEFTGFEPAMLRDIRVRAGDNKHIVVLKIQGLSETVNVGEEGQAAASSRTGNSFGVKLSDEQLDALSDDPAEMAKQLQDLAGPNAIIRVDSFEGMQLPPKAQIKSVHVTRDQFAAESPNPGDTFVEIITQPGIGPIRGGFNANVRAGALTARENPARAVSNSHRTWTTSEARTRGAPACGWTCTATARIPTATISGRTRFPASRLSTPELPPRTRGQSVTRWCPTSTVSSASTSRTICESPKA